MPQKPTYDLYQVQEIALDKRKCFTTKRVEQWLTNHDYPRDTVQSIVLSLKEEGFRKSVKLKHIPGKNADVYCAEYEGEKWYVKLFIDEDTKMARIVRIWSCCPDGAIH